MHVRWWYVANLLQALCKLEPYVGYWRPDEGDSKEAQPMHKYYDRRLFDYYDSVDALKLHFAPKYRDEVLLTGAELANMGEAEKIKAAADVSAVSQFIDAGFDVHFVGPADEAPQSKATTDVEALQSSTSADEADKHLFVDAQTFQEWLGNSQFERGVEVQRWWTDLQVGDEGEIGALKEEDDETYDDFFRRIRVAVQEGAEDKKLVVNDVLSLIHI